MELLRFYSSTPQVVIPDNNIVEGNDNTPTYIPPMVSSQKNGVGDSRAGEYFFAFPKIPSLSPRSPSDFLLSSFLLPSAVNISSLFPLLSPNY